MVNELLNKGRQALSIGEWERARKLLEEALNKDESPEIYEELGWAFWWLNDAVSVFDYRLKAYNLFLDKDNKPGAARNAIWIGIDHIEFKGEFAVAGGWFQRAENLLEGINNTWEAGLMKITKARWAFQAEKNTELAFKLIDESLQISKLIKSIDGEMLCEALKGFILVVEGRISEGMSLLDEATLLALTHENSDIKTTTTTYCFLIDACERIRDYERANEWCNNVREICKRWRYKAMFANCKMKHAGVLIWKGDWKEAEEELSSAITELKELRPAQINACIVRLADLRRRQGKWNEAEKLLNEVGSHPLKQLYCAALFYDKEEYENALNPAERYLRQIPVKEKGERAVGVELLLRIYVKLGKLDHVEILLNELSEITNSINTLPLKAALLNAKGIYNFGSNNLELAKENLEDAVDLYDKITLTFEAAKCRVLLSEISFKLNKLVQAEAELNSAIATFEELGAEKDSEKAKHVLKNLYKVNTDDLNKNEYEFTGRELEVLRLITEGKSNDEIAEKLFLSTRTVEKHITNIYSKMGISGKSARAYAASYAIKHNLIFS
jgi:ATP/maltotriose-dependent transcriptional regulator MalT